LRQRGSHCIGEPGGPTSITGTARFALATFYIAITLSGHTAERGCGELVVVGLPGR